MSMHIEVYKEPWVENDAYYFKVSNLNSNKIKSAFEKLIQEDDYLWAKVKAFADFDLSSKNFEKFSSDRPSLQNISSLDKLVGSIYTYASERRNEMSYSELIECSKELYEENKCNRRNVIRLVNSFADYYRSSKSPYDVSCLNLIQFYDKTAKLVFRASDIKNELLTDIVTVYKFFIEPIMNCENDFDLEVMALTGQNADYFDNFLLDFEMSVS